MSRTESVEALRLRFPSLLQDQHNADVEQVRDVAHVKRFLERWSMDNHYRESFDRDPSAAFAELGLAVTLDDVVPFIGTWAAERGWWRERGLEEGTTTLASRRYLDFLRDKIGHRRALRAEAAPSARRQAAWRQRQVNRSAVELGPKKADALVHAPIAFELAKGCTVGCWFCGVAAERFEGWFEYTSENSGTWRGVLEASHRVIGEAAAHGFCYWATDPLDNPDYERFLIDFHRSLGRWPQTTTAIPHRDLGRTARLLQLAREHGSEINRFSILSTGILRRIHDAFSPEELLLVELLPQNKGALPSYKKARAGRALKFLDRRREEIVSGNASTIACISGFLVNVLEGRVRLITPCNANERWPLGYWVLAEGFFRSPEEYEALLTSMVEQHMICELDISTPLRLRPDVRVEWDGAQAIVVSHALKLTWPPNPGNDLILDRLQQGEPTAVELAVELERERDRSMPETLAFLGQLYDTGLLWEEPSVPEAAAPELVQLAGGAA